MRTAGRLSTFVCALTIAASVEAQQRPAFAGRWTLNPDASKTMGGGRGDASGNASGGGGAAGGGIGLGPPALELSIQQNDTTLTVEERGDRDRVSSLVYRLDGKKTANAMALGRGRTADATYSSRWNGPKLVTTIIRGVNARGREVRVEYKESRYLASDGSMVVETALEGRPDGRKAVYRRAESTGASEAASKTEGVLTTRASGTFEVKLNPLPAYETAEAAMLGRLSIDKQFSGDLVGTSKGEMLSAGTAVKNSAGYVAIERVSGTLHGRTGTFVLQHSGTMTRGAPTLTITVVPDSGTGQLAGLAGTMIIKIEGGKHLYEFDYTLAAAP